MLSKKGGDSRSLLFLFFFNSCVAPLPCLEITWNIFQLLEQHFSSSILWNNKIAQDSLFPSGKKLPRALWFPPQFSGPKLPVLFSPLCVGKSGKSSDRFSHFFWGEERHLTLSKNDAIKPRKRNQQFRKRLKHLLWTIFQFVARHLRIMFAIGSGSVLISWTFFVVLFGKE